MIRFLKKKEIKQNPNLRVRSEYSKEIAKSVREDGIFTPLIVDKNLVLYDGYSRLFFSKQEEIPAIVFESEREAFLKSVSFNMLAKRYSEFEKARVVKIAVDFLGFPEREVVEKINPVLKFSKKVSVVEECLSIFNLEKSLFDLLEEKKSPIRVAVSFLREDKQNQSFLAKIFSEKRLSLSQIQIVYDLMFYIRKREKLNFEEIHEKCGEEDFISCLKKMRFPSYSVFSEKLKGIIADYSGFLHFPEDFEATDFSFRAKVKNPSDIEKIEKILEKIGQDKKIWDFLKKVRADD